MSVLYFDHNRTTPLAASVLEAMAPYWSTHFLLPDQDHPHAQAVGEALEHARESVAAMAGCEPFEIVFTAGGTESNNLAIRGLAGGLPPGHVLVSTLEHQSVVGSVESLADAGWEREWLPCEPDGVVDPDRLLASIRADTRLACIQLANPILGTVQPVRAIADLCHGRGVAVHCDATQAFGKIAVSAERLRVDTMAISGHKFYGPKGSGALFVRRGLPLSPILFGEPREMGLRPGAENVPAAIGLGAAATLAARGSERAIGGLAELKSRFINGVIDAIEPTPIRLCSEAESLPNTVALEMAGDARRILRQARQLVGATAQSDTPPDEMTRILRSIGRTDRQVGRTLSLSLGWTTTRDQVDRAVELLADACDTAAAY